MGGLVQLGATNSESLTKRDQRGIARERVIQRYSLLRTIVRAVAVVSAVYVAKDLLIGIAGTETALALKLSLLGDVKFAVSITTALGASFWAFAERWLRHREVNQMQGRIIELETIVDQKRSSSGLTAKGTTNPRDKVR